MPKPETPFAGQIECKCDQIFGLFEQYAPPAVEYGGASTHAQISMLRKSLRISTGERSLHTMWPGGAIIWRRRTTLYGCGNTAIGRADNGWSLREAPRRRSSHPRKLLTSFTCRFARINLHATAPPDLGEHVNIRKIRRDSA
jgi:hypothetical protein